MKRRIKHIIVAGLLAIGLFTPLALATSTAQAADIYKGCSGSGASSVICANKDNTDANSAVENIVKILLFVLGIIAVIVIIIGGLRYVVSGGDANAVKGAKDMILYAVVGLIVAIMAYAIVSFVVGSFSSGGGGNNNGGGSNQTQTQTGNNNGSNSN